MEWWNPPGVWTSISIVELASGPCSPNLLGTVSRIGEVLQMSGVGEGLECKRVYFKFSSSHQ
jgi:hypothetical protein